MDDKDLKQNDNTENITSEEVVEENPAAKIETGEVSEEISEVSSDDVAVEPEPNSDGELKTKKIAREGTVDEEKTETPKEAPKKTMDMKGKWYIVHTYSGHENKVAKTLMQRVQSMGYDDRIYDAIVPTRETIRIRAGKKEKIKEKIFPGYILVNMDLTDESWILVRTTPGVTSFVGAENKPTPIRDDEVAAIIEFVDRKEPVYKAQFSIGEAVKINDGPFSDFLGTVESIDQEKGKIKVLVSIFGRETPVELDFLQVTKI